MSEHTMDQLVDKIEASQWRVSIIVGLGSILLAVLLAWLLARSDMIEIHEMIRESKCNCKNSVATNTNQVTIHADDRETVVRDVLKKRGEIE